MPTPSLESLASSSYVFIQDGEFYNKIKLKDPGPEKDES